MCACAGVCVSVDVQVCVCSASSAASFCFPHTSPTPVLKYVSVHFWILVGKLVMLISHCVLQRHQGDSLKKSGMFFMQMKLGMKLKEGKHGLYRYAPSVWGAGVVSACACGNSRAVVSVCVRVCKGGMHLCICEWAQVGCELGRWTFGAALHPEAKHTRAQTHSHSHARL